MRLTPGAVEDGASAIRGKSPDELKNPALNIEIGAQYLTGPAGTGKIMCQGHPPTSRV